MVDSRQLLAYFKQLADTALEESRFKLRQIIEIPDYVARSKAPLVPTNIRHEFLKKKGRNELDVFEDLLLNFAYQDIRRFHYKTILPVFEPTEEILNVIDAVASYGAYVSNFSFEYFEDEMDEDFREGRREAYVAKAMIWDMHNHLYFNGWPEKETAKKLMPKLVEIYDVAGMEELREAILKSFRPDLREYT